MKSKYLLLLIFLFLLSFASGCKKEKVNFETFASSLTLSKNEELQGYEQILEISSDSLVLFKEKRVLAPHEETYLLTTQVIKRLNGLEADSQYSENEAPITTEITDLDNTISINFLEEYFFEFEIDIINCRFTGSVIESSAKQFMNDDSFSGKEISIIINLNKTTFHLTEIILNYQTESGRFTTIKTTFIY